MRKAYLSIATLILVACGGGSKESLPSGSRDEEAAQEECIAGGNGKVESIDLDGDGQPDVRHLIRNGKRYCSELDPNRDGQVDVVRFYDEQGRPRRDEHHFDYDGKADEIAFYKDGVIERRELDTNFDSRLDTWIWCKGDHVAHSERDRSGNGQVDTWEEYEDGIIVEARYDQNNDGEADRWEKYQAGRLAVIELDENGDGKADSKEVIPEDERGMPDDRLSCRLLDANERVPQEHPVKPSGSQPPISDEGSSATKSNPNETDETSSGDGQTSDKAGGNQ